MIKYIKPIAAKESSPFIVLCTYEEPSEEFIKKIKEKIQKDFTLAIFYNFDWDNDLTPYESDSFNKGDKFLGNAKSTLSYIESVINKEMQSAPKPTYFGIVGYSLAGLFAISSSYYSSTFTRIASCSGSLWYPGFIDWIKGVKIENKALYTYLSLGDKEKITKNDIMKTIENKTLEYYDYLTKNGCKCFFEFNHGGHFKEPEERTIKGILSLLNFNLQKLSNMKISKTELRKKYLNIRKDIFKKTELSLEIFNIVYGLKEYKNAKVIALFSSMKDEIDTTSFALRCLKDHKKICFPRVVSNGNMEFYFVSSLNELNDVGQFKIKEPSQNWRNLVKKDDIDLMIMPGICFDRKLNRVGFGKGYYDNYLRGQSNIYKLVVTFSDLIINDEIASTKNDVLVDKIVSEKEIIG